MTRKLLPGSNRIFVTQQGQLANNFTVIRTTDDVVEHVFSVGDDPGDTNVTASFILYTGEGQMTVPALTDVTIPARGTFTANLNDYVASYDVSTRVVVKGLVTGKRMTSCPGSGWCTASGAFTMNI